MAFLSPKPFVANPEGPTDKAYVQGWLAAEDNRRANNAEIRQERTLGMQEEQQGWARDSWLREKTIQEGMALAGQRGGYEAVIDYLKSADPERGLKFHSAKLQLDASMMKNNMYAAMMPLQQAKALAEGYGVLGKMGMAINSAKDENEAQEMYNQVLPIVKAINPDAPADFKSAAPMFMLAAAQAMPENILYQSEKESNAMKTKMGQTLTDLDLAVQKYGVDSPQVKLLEKQIYDLSEGDSVAKEKIAAVVAKNKQSGEHSLRTQWLSQVKEYRILANAYKNVQAAFNNTQDPVTGLKGPDDMTLIYNYYKMLDPNSVIMPGEYANAENTRGWSDSMRVQYNKIQNGDKLSDSQRKAFLHASGTIFKTQQQQYNTLKGQYTDIALSNGYNPQNVIIAQDTTVIDPSIMQQAQEAIDAGAPRDAVMQRLQELQQRKSYGQ